MLLQILTTVVVLMLTMQAGWVYNSCIVILKK